VIISGKTCSTHGEIRNAYKILVGKLEERPLGRPRDTCENIRMGLKEICCKGTEWIQLAQDMVQQQIHENMVMSFQVQ
jgi:hypothetical protein